MGELLANREQGTLHRIKDHRITNYTTKLPKQKNLEHQFDTDTR